MRFPRLRFTVRRLMIVVALVAVALAAGTWVAEMVGRSRRYEALSRWHAIQEDLDRSDIEVRSLMLNFDKNYLAGLKNMDDAKAPGSDVDPRIAALTLKLEKDRARHEVAQADLEIIRRQLEYDLRMKEKYARAAEHPWAAFPPDPPRPE